jgi:ATP-dependent DNA helicase RecG
MQSLQNISIQYVKGVGPERRKIFYRLGVETIEDLFYFFPRHYEDRTHLTAIARLKVGEDQTVKGRILGCSSRRSWYTKKHVVEVILDDGSGRLSCVWFNQRFLASYFKTGRWVICYGKVEMYKNSLQMASPEWEIIEEKDEGHLNSGRIVPIYPLTRGVTQRYLRKTVMACLERYKDDLTDDLPIPLRNKYRLYNIKRSITNVHFPQTLEDQGNAIRRISFEEFFFFQISVIQRRLSITQKEGFAHQASDAQTLKFVHAFPFELTVAQKRVIQEIRADMQRSVPMLRLLQGDVGSGKTVAALFGCMTAFENGFQSCLMAPTEILARQHYENIAKMIEDGRFRGMRMAILVSGLGKKERERLCTEIREGKIDLVIGTHALIQEGVIFKNLSFVVIDEQHKFGVRQRALLTQKGNNPDVLIMTATPIPRTLCITLYGDMDVSVLDEMPPGRGKIKTLLYSGEQSQEAYDLMRDNLRHGRQAYVVYPIIEDSETLDLKAAQEMFEYFQREEFRDFRVGLVHGRMKPKQSREIMDRFRNREIDLLVATTVLEVGVDVPNASVMFVEHAERFGLAQLHQLRGRIGRGEADGLCILIADPQTDEGRDRLRAFLSTHDGFKIAEYDLKIRGPGRYFGRHQHGLNELKVANPMTQLDVLELARKEAVALTQGDPNLGNPPNRYIRDVIRRRYPTYLSMVTAG